MASLEFEDAFNTDTSALWSRPEAVHRVVDERMPTGKTLSAMSIRELVRAIAESWRLMYQDVVDRQPVDVIFRPERRAHIGLTVSFVSILLLVLINGDRR